MKKYLMSTIAIALAVVCATPFAPMAQAAGEDLTWTSHSAGEGSYDAVTWSPELSLFVAVAESGVDNISHVATSPDGENWTVGQAPENNEWADVVWSSEQSQFVAVAASGTDRVMTSPDGVNWTSQNATGVAEWSAITWSPSLGIYVAVSDDLGSVDQVMTSPDGINWTPHTAASSQNWKDVTWSPDLNLFVTVSSSATNGGVMTSPDGENWTGHDAPAPGWVSVAWSPERGIFVAVAGNDSGSPNVMTSPDGINWTGHQGASGLWEAVTWAPGAGLFVAVSDQILNSAHQVMASSDGTNWTPLPAVDQDNYWRDITWSPQLQEFVAIGNLKTNRAMSTASVLTIPNAPTNLQATAANENEAQLTWNAPVDDGSTTISGYMIERSVAGGPFNTLVANTNSTDTTYTDTGLDLNTSYTYRVSAINNIGTSDPSNQASVTLTGTAAGTPTEEGSTTGGDNALAATGANNAVYLLGSSVFILLGVVFILRNMLGHLISKLT